MNWEDLTVYKPLRKEDLKLAYKDFTRIVADNLFQDGFENRGRKLIKQSDDLFHIIHLDTRGSWMGTSDSFKTEISICSVYDTDTFVLNHELSASKKIEDLVPKIRNYYRITQEYQLLADSITRKIREYILPYFSRYQTSKDVLNNRRRFKLDNLTEITERNSNLILYCELTNKIDIVSSKILSTRLAKFRSLKNADSSIKEADELLHLIQEKNWDKINEKLIDNKRQVFKKLKLKEN
jgi:hypothetical protein